MNRKEFEDKFLESINILVEMENIFLPYFQLPNGDTISILRYPPNGIVKCFRGSLMIYRFLTQRDDKDHLRILAEYVYKHHDDKQCRKILDDLKIEMVNQV